MARLLKRMTATIKPLREIGQIPSAKLTPTVPVLIAAAMTICLSVLIGWRTHSLIIVGFGREDISMQPWTAAGSIALSLAVLCVSTRLFVPARCLAMVPLSIAVAVLVQEVTGSYLGVDQLLFADSVQHQSRLYPGRPGLMPTICLLLLALAILASISPRIQVRRLITGLAFLTLCIATLAGTLLPMSFSPLTAEVRHAVMSLPSATTFAILAVALLMHRREIIWPDNPGCRLSRTSLQWLFLACALLPMLMASWEMRSFAYATITREMAELISAAIQVAASCAMIAWAWVRIGRESTVRWAFSKAVDSAPIAITDIDGRIIRWSKGCERLYGFTTEQALGQFKYRLTSAQFPPGPDRPPVSECPQEAEVTERRRDGTRLRIVESSQIVQPRPDIAPMIVLSMTDITPRQRAERAMLASEARLAFAADVHELGLFEWSAETDTFHLSPQAERLFGIGPGFHGGVEEWRSHIRKNFGADILADKPLPSTVSQKVAFRLCSVGTYEPRHIEGSIFFYAPTDNRSAAMLGIIMDVTDRERRTEALQAREAELRSILETVPKALITVDKHGRVRTFSSAAERLFGYIADEVLGANIGILLPDYIESLTAARGTSPEKSWLSKATEWQITTAIDRYGNEMPVELALGETAIGNELISIAFVHDLREQLATQARLDELRDQLLHAARVSAMGEMGAGLAHELNQPLTASSNYLGAASLSLTYGSSKEELQDLVRLASLEVLRAGEIIRSMRAFVAKGDLDLRALPLDELVTDALQLAMSGSRHAGVSLQYHPSTSSSVVLADQVQIQQVLVNIIGNALETFAAHNIEKPEIQILSSEQPDGSILIQVLDNGPGFPPAIIDHPFEAFVSTRANGIGLGLSICRRIVEGHAGTLTFGNKAEGGAIIEFTLPSHREADPKGTG